MREIVQNVTYWKEIDTDDDSGKQIILKLPETEGIQKIV